jgi:hypothetical protein
MCRIGDCDSGGLHPGEGVALYDFFMSMVVYEVKEAAASSKIGQNCSGANFVSAILKLHSCRIRQDLVWEYSAKKREEPTRNSER